MKLAESILQLIGGKENVGQIWHCMTRIRFTAKDNSLVKLDEIGKLEGVVGTRYQNGQNQIIIGNNVAKVYEEVETLIGTQVKSESVKKPGNILNSVFDTISGLFNPILPAIVGTGLLKAVLALVVLMAPGAAETQVYEIFNIISDAAFYFLPFLLAASGSRVFNVDMSLTLVVAGAMMYPTILNNAGTSVSFFGINLPYLNYSSSVIPIILSVILLKYVDRFFKKVIPNMFTYVFTPMLTLCVTIPLSLMFLAPLGTYASTYFAEGINWLFANFAPLAGFLYVGLMPLIIMVGMHYAFFPTAIQSIQTLGYDVVLLPANLIHNVAQAGAAFAVGLKAKKKSTKSIAFSTGISAIFGITEPAMYGINLKYKKPFYAVMISSGIVGAIAVTLGLKAYAFATPGILSLPGYAQGTSFNLILALGSYVASFALAFGITMVWKFEIDDEEVELSTTISSPIKGQLVPLSQVQDKVFSEKLMGNGIAIIPEEDTFHAPFDGIVKMIFNTKHAIAFESATGVELLYHIGLDTVNLKGQYFELLVEEGDTVTQGQPVIKIDREKILAENYDLITPLIITNHQEFPEIEFLMESGSTHTGQALFTVETKEV